jgi:hypothetical protein
MKFLISLITSILFFLPKPPIPTPTPIIFHPYPSSEISVNWGTSAPDYTIFLITNMLPGDSTNHSIMVTNTSSASRPLTVKATQTSELKNFSQILTITIFKDNLPIYGPKLLTQFFTDSAASSGISLDNLPGHATSTFKFLVAFPSAAGNEYQQAQIIFNLQIGKLLDIPGKCHKFHDEDGHDFTVDSGHKHVFASFDCEDHIDDNNTNHCTVIHSQ